ncbi:signal transduction histidine kinase [Catenulispora sp. EB89]|uniref:sensor histidine kinase n=1 Tax=Catenulispora sp. EB89 TaxID=3156257 RepID=UPI00351446E0
MSTGTSTSAGPATRATRSARAARAVRATAQATARAAGQVRSWGEALSRLAAADVADVLGAPSAGHTGLIMSSGTEEFPDLRRWTERWPAVAVVLRLVAIGGVSFTVAHSHRPAAWVFGAMAALAGVVWSVSAVRRIPVLVPAVAVIALCGAVLAGPGLAEPSGLTYVFMSVMYLQAMTEARATALYVGIAAVVVGAVSAVAANDGSQFPWVVAVTVSGYLFGDARRSRRLALERAQDLLVMTRRANTEQAHAAALAERGRIARDVHDVLAHSLSGLAIQLEAADALMTDGADLERAHTMVIRARRLARDGLSEVRRAVAALREDVKPPEETLAVLAADYAEVTGWPATFEVVDGPVPELAVETAQTLQRVAQEALTNARKHAPGAAVAVRLAVGADTVTLTVENEASTRPSTPLSDSGGGWGLVGLRERVGLVGGSVEAGGTEGGGFRVAAVVPVEFGGTPA